MQNQNIPINVGDTLFFEHGDQCIVMIYFGFGITYASIGEIVVLNRHFRG
ncbi:hypothetical protein SAMN05192585_13028 [Acetanaerobacterium elongatum]|uniref:Uncharacterized protein n=1 Tax=Acetanaerobacterium elongatum TaxID=258515 RepID=A0A1H0DUU7_9FIRM|nr:hypothetical protein SAMN05192585_13028 [Acetanaerobacterium elongatum]